MRQRHADVIGLARTVQTYRVATSAGAKVIVAVLMLLGSVASNAASWTGYFSITGLYLSGEGNYHLRAAGVPAAANCAAGWAYMNQADSGSRDYIAALMMAYAMGKQVNLFVAPDANGYCHIIEASI